MATAEIYTTEQEHAELFGIRLSAIIETAVFLGFLLLMDAVFGAGNRFMGVEPHPFWIIVVVAAVQYGTGEALFAAFASSVALLLFNMPEQVLGQDSYDYLLILFRLPLLWMISAVLIGSIRQRHVKERDRLRQEVAESHERERVIAESYSAVRSLKEKLELKIASQLRASTSAFRAAKAIEKNHPTEVLQGLQELVRSTMQPEKFSVFSLQDEVLTPAITFGWHSDDNYIERITPQDDLYRRVIGDQQVLCIANTDHQRVLGSEGVLAGPLIDKETGQISGMLKIEQIGFLELNLSTIETFHAICDWVGMAMANAERYQDAKEGSMVNPDNTLMSHSYYRQYTDFISALGKRVGFSVNMIVIQLTNANRLTSEQRTQSARIVAEAVREVLRSIDMAFDYQKDGEEFSIVLPATNRSGAKIVLGKLEKSIKKMVPASMPSEFSLTTHTIHEA